jgi:hypothetical protein
VGEAGRKHTSILLTPNPVRSGDHVTLIADESATQHIRVQTILGEEVRVITSSSSAGQVEIETEGIAPGLYLVTVEGVTVRMVVY